MSLLNEHIESTECLNQDTNFPVANIFNKSELVLKSDADHQLLIKLKFRQPLKLSALKLVGANADTCPSTVRLFVNMPHIGFSEAEDNPSTQDFEVKPEDLNCPDDKNAALELKFVKFQNVTELAIFVQENAGQEEISELKSLEIFGQSGEASNIADWKPVKG